MLMADNGLGIAPERLEATRKNMYEGSDDPDADIGLRNVYMRLKYFYGENFTMEIGNNPEEGRVFRLYSDTGRKGGELLYTLVIVDDEPNILEGIKRLLDWKSLGFGRIETARSSMEVMSHILDWRPDICLMDVCIGNDKVMR